MTENGKFNSAFKELDNRINKDSTVEDLVKELGRVVEKYDIKDAVTKTKLLTTKYKKECDRAV